MYPMNMCLLIALMQRTQKNSSCFQSSFHRHLFTHTSGTELEVTDMIPNCRAATALLISQIPDNQSQVRICPKEGYGFCFYVSKQLSYTISSC